MRSTTLCVPSPVPSAIAPPTCLDVWVGENVIRFTILISIIFYFFRFERHAARLLSLPEWIAFLSIMQGEGVPLAKQRRAR